MHKYNLKYPYTMPGGARLETVEIRRLTRGDIRKAHHYAKDDDVGQESFLLAAMVGVVPEDLDPMDIADSKALVEFFRNMVESKGDATSD
ncbi:MAG: phage tail assembly protein [Pseudomonas sp.]|uniref:phage tail assembly protein n=1 Tax=Pseudomonas sp. TaxID=306 RepID=UPI002733A718|nr:phage tail assembly protein [Pseudomonas sp.]MDP3848110.1 phage tail assembly protein [Pseudomonas sp.]